MPKSDSVFRYRIRNWRDYNHALINRGRLTVCLTSTLLRRGGIPILGKEQEPSGCILISPLNAPWSSNRSITSVCVLPRASPIPDYSTVSRRQGVLQLHLSPSLCT